MAPATVIGQSRFWHEHWNLKAQRLNLNQYVPSLFARVHMAPATLLGRVSGTKPGTPGGSKGFMTVVSSSPSDVHVGPCGIRPMRWQNSREDAEVVFIFIARDCLYELIDR